MDSAGANGASFDEVFRQRTSELRLAEGQSLMPFDVEAITNSKLGIRLLASIAAKMPRAVGYRIADMVAWQMARRRRSSIVRAVRGNQWVVRGENPASDGLDRAVHLTLQHSARSVFDLYHYIDNPEAVKPLVVLEPPLDELVKRPEFADRGLLVSGVHTRSFDLLVRWFVLQGVKPLVLTLPDPRGARRLEYEMRRQIGMNLVPANVAGLRRAVRHLEQGGAVLTSVDFPVPRPRARPRFFGRPSALPVHHVFLATQARVPIVVMAPILEADGKFHIKTSDFIEMDSRAGGGDGALQNAELVLHTAEDIIRRAPQQWSVPHPVWPSTLDMVPE